MKGHGLYLSVAVLMAVLANGSLTAGEEIRYPDPTRWEEAIERYREWDSKNAPPQDPVLFVGSSSIVGWKTAEAFPDLPVMNRGFGGSYTADLLYYVDTLVIPYRPRVIVLYEGDNDIAGGIPPQRVHQDFIQLIDRIHAALPQTHIIYVPAKICRARWDKRGAVTELNRLNKALIDSKDYLTYIDTVSVLLDEDGKPISDCFLDDQLHLNEKGYARWNTVLAPVLAKTLDSK